MEKDRTKSLKVRKNQCSREKKKIYRISFHVNQAVEIYLKSMKPKEIYKKLKNRNGGKLKRLVNYLRLNLSRN